MKPIDADKLYDKLMHDTLTVYDANDREYIVKSHVAAAIEDAPTVDAVEVVRCKDCRFGEGDLICVNPKCVKSWYGCQIGPEHFCSYGERRSKGEDGD